MQNRVYLLDYSSMVKYYDIGEIFKILSFLLEDT